MTEELFALRIGKQLDIYGGPDQGTEYSMENACPTCGTGAQQVGPLRLKRFRLPKAKIFMTLDDEVLVQRELADEMGAHGVTSLGEVLDAETKKPMNVLQLRPEAVLPPFSPESKGIVRDRPCPVCKRDGYYGVPNEPYVFQYSRLDAQLASKDVLATYERFGVSRLREPFKDSVFAAPVLVVGPRVAGTLEGAKLSYVDLLPVRVIS